MDTMKTGKILVVALVLALATAVWAPWQAALADPSLDTVRASSKTIETLIREMTHVVQQGWRSSGSTTTVGASRSITVGANKTVTVGNDRTQTVDNNETMTIGSNRTETAGEGITSNRVRLGGSAATRPSGIEGKTDDKSSTWVRVPQLHAYDNAGRITRLSNRVLSETRKMEIIYRQRNLPEGLRHVKAIAAEAEKINKLGRDLGSSPTASQASQYYTRVSERLRQKSRARDGHDKWIDVLSLSWPSHGKPGEEIPTDEYGRVKVQMSNDRQSQAVEELSPKKMPGTKGDPDRPLVTGRVYSGDGKQAAYRKIELEKAIVSSHSTGSSSGEDKPTESVTFNFSKVEMDSKSGSSSGKERPTEHISLNFAKVRMSSTSVHGIYQLDGRLTFLGDGNQLYALPDGRYTGKGDAEVEVKAGPIRGDIVVRTPTGASPDDNSKNTSGRQASGGMTSRRINSVRLSVKSSDGRYSEPGGAWFELKGGNIVKIGGSLDRHNPPPFLDVGGDRGAKGPSGSSRGNVETEFKVEKGEK